MSVSVDRHDCFCIRVLCETVKDFVSKIGTASANSDPSEADEPDSLAQKVGNLDWHRGLHFKSAILCFSRKQYFIIIQIFHHHSNFSFKLSYVEESMNEVFRVYRHLRLRVIRINSRSPFQIRNSLMILIKNWCAESFKGRCLYYILVFSPFGLFTPH